MISYIKSNNFLKEYTYLLIYMQLMDVYKYMVHPHKQRKPQVLLSL